MDHKAEAIRAEGVYSSLFPDFEYPDLAAVMQMHATLYLAEQQRLANKLTIALVDQVAELTRISAPVSYPNDPAVPFREYLTASEWKELDN